LALHIIAQYDIGIRQSDNTYIESDVSVSGVIIEAADFNNDGLIDLVTQRNENNMFADQELLMHYNQGDDTFVSEIISTGLDYGDIDFGDIDGDGDLDIVALDYLEDLPLLVLTNDGSSFSTQRTNHFPLLSNSNIYLVDMDNDNDLDIIMNDRSSGLWIIENKEDFLLGDQLIYYDTPQINYFKHADLNNDGNEDIIFWGGNAPSSINIYVLEGKGNLDFEERVVIGSFERPAGLSYPNNNYTANNISIIDFDNDSKLDIIYTDGYNDPNQLTLLTNNSTISSTINPNQTPHAITVFPNPTSKYLFVTSNSSIDLENTEYSIMSPNGQVVQEGEIIDGLISVQGLAKGEYFLRFENLNQVVTIVLH